MFITPRHAQELHQKENSECVCMYVCLRLRECVFLCVRMCESYKGVCPSRTATIISTLWSNDALHHHTLHSFISSWNSHLGMLVSLLVLNFEYMSSLKVVHLVGMQPATILLCQPYCLLCSVVRKQVAHGPWWDDSSHHHASQPLPSSLPFHAILIFLFFWSLHILLVVPWIVLLGPTSK
jgi:hypothetical protein